jgi:hypothetical protein
MSNESFIPPAQNFPFLWFLDVAIDSLLLAVHNIDRVEITEKDKEMLKTFKDKRLIYISNHPSTREPPVAFVVSKYMYSRFFYMAGREVFDWGYGMVGKVIQSVGAYSVIAGIGDRESLKTTRNIIAKPAGKLCLFPEGEPTGNENDTLLPFQPGVTQLGFWGYEDALKTDPKAEVYILPAFVKYRLRDSIAKIREDVHYSLVKLEKYFGIRGDNKSFSERLLSIGKRLIEREERKLGIKPDESKTFEYRIGRLRHTILDHVAEKAGIKKYNKEANAIEKLRTILSTFEMVQVGVPDPKKELPSLEMANWGRKYCQIVYDFIAIDPNYLTSFPSPERIYEWIYKFENELFGSFQPRPTRAYVSFSEPILLSEKYKEYKSSKNKKEVVDGLTMHLRNKIQELLEAEKRKSYTI